MVQRIPLDALEPDTLEALLGEIVTRDGTDYGDVETPTATRVAQLRRELESGRAVLVFDEESESCSVLPREQAPPEGADVPRRDDLADM